MSTVQLAHVMDMFYSTMSQMNETYTKGDYKHKISRQTFLGHVYTIMSIQFVSFGYFNKMAACVLDVPNQTVTIKINFCKNFHKYCLLIFALLYIIL